MDNLINFWDTLKTHNLHINSGNEMRIKSLHSTIKTVDTYIDL